MDINVKVTIGAEPELIMHLRERCAESKQKPADGT